MKGRPPAPQWKAIPDNVFLPQQKHFHHHLNVLEQRLRKSLRPGQTSKTDTESSLQQSKLPAQRKWAQLTHWDARHNTIITSAVRTHCSGFQGELSPVTFQIYPPKFQGKMNKREMRGSWEPLKGVEWGRSPWGSEGHLSSQDVQRHRDRNEGERWLPTQSRDRIQLTFA